jgi:hypothetical protein
MNMLTRFLPGFENGWFKLMHKTPVWMVPFFFLLLIAQSCFDPKESCLDIAATNFNAEADKNCCCKYPKLVLNVDQTYGTELYRQDSLFLGLNGQSFRIKSIVWYVSDFQLTKNGETFIAGDSTDFKVYETSNDDTVTINLIDDFTLIRRVPLANEVASFREDGVFEKVKFRLGLPEKAQHILPELAPSAHPLRPQTEQLYQNEYIFLQAIVVRDADPNTTPDTLNFFKADLGDFFVEGTDSFVHPIGYDFPINLHADWEVLFSGVDWSNNNPQSWKAQIVANLPSVFTVFP